MFFHNCIGKQVDYIRKILILKDYYLLLTSYQILLILYKIAKYLKYELFVIVFVNSMNIFSFF
jgi:hypothetical protein